MAQVRCESVTDGLRASEALANVRDYSGRRHTIRVERDFLTAAGGGYYLPMGLIHIDAATGAVLLEFPQAPETGYNRVWVKPEFVDLMPETTAA